MGKKEGRLYINPKKFGAGGKPCMKEMMSFLTCLRLCQNDDEKCGHQKQLLNTCINTQNVKAKKQPWGSINYHLQRLSRLKK